jgi:uncharacterized membrane protein YkvA (DUF1232 family)
MDKKLDDEKMKRVVEDGAKDINEEKVGETVAREAELNAKIALVPGWFDKQVKKFKLLFALLKDWWDGKYPEIPWASIALITFAIIYFLNPVDLIPDVIPVIGYIDDATVLALVWQAIEHDLKIYAEKTGKDMTVFS